MELHQALDAVRNDRVRFVTLRPTDTPFATLERRVVVTAPPELIELAQSGSIAALDALIALLTDPQRAWAAEVILAALTGQ